MRCVPDVAAVADADYSLVNVGMQYQPVNGTNYGVLVYDGSGNPAGNDAVGGTSVACPIWAGITAIVNQARLSNGKGPIGLLNPHLYPLVGTNVFNDITSGNNEAYSAGPGYDLCTGLGTPNVANLVAALAGNPSQRLANISTRALVGTGGNILIPGLYISGTGIEALLIRADGPALTQFGVSGVLTKPTLSVYDSSGKLVTSNTGWMTDPNYLFLAMEAAKVGAFQLGNSSADCEIVTGLAPGAYTVQVSGVADTSGVALAEVYEVASYGTARLANMSTRAMVGTGGNIIIPGIYISGAGVEELLVRADGPALAQFGVSGVLARPTLSVFNSVGTMVASNTGWGTGADAAQIPAISASVGAFPLAANSADCALIVKLEAGSYTIQVSGVGNSTGIALAEVYEITSP
jgi:subtilase family serine protease